MHPLKHLALQKCLRYINYITDVGEAPYELMEPILCKMSAPGLEAIEKASPQLRDRTDPLWKALLVRDFPTKDIPSTNFRSAYAKNHKEKQRRLKSVSQKLRASTESLNEQKSMMKITPLDDIPLSIKRAELARKLSNTPKKNLSIMQKARMEVRDNLRSRSKVHKPIRVTASSVIASQNNSHDQSSHNQTRSSTIPSVFSKPRK
ncbi:hypothetical protein CANCADRAFT_73119 [Tortispora caseinolytica NRRL Y-17796]|uniref:Elongin-A n=1 Tax=Tortispora caseinolytica NRRL Y-17796 TaxID=767744 RepID=A0A1E4TIL8_9ASCO|nr:hypothetical protein CANCADRAFT_73119 [Tortispora caseinolytica NRRL Y-17796]